MNKLSNSQLFANENGRVAFDALRPLTQTTATSSAISLSPIDSAEAYILARKVDAAAPDLQVAVNGTTCTFADVVSEIPCWYRAPVASAALRSGDNILEVAPQTGWEVAYEAASGQPLLRLRVWSEGAANAPAFPVYGDPAITGNREEWLALLPESLREPRDIWQWSWDLAEFTAGAWPYANELDGGASYAPWDARTILRWGRARCDDNGVCAIAMCVHYAVVYVQFAIALGIPARAVVITSALNRPCGHFIAEVWLEEYQTWAMIDPNLHLCFLDKATGRPLSTHELCLMTESPRHLAQHGETFGQMERLGDFLNDDCLTGNVYGHWSVWGRHDWIDRPDLAPPAHGALPYAETDIIWCCDGGADPLELAMFPQFLTAAQLSVGPNQ